MRCGRGGRGKGVHGVYEAWTDAHELESAQTALIEVVQLVSEDGPVDWRVHGHLQRGKHVEDMQIAVHHEGLQCCFQFVVDEQAVFGRETRRNYGLAESGRFVGLVVTEVQETLFC